LEVYTARGVLDLPLLELDFVIREISAFSDSPSRLLNCSRGICRHNDDIAHFKTHQVADPAVDNNKGDVVNKTGVDTKNPIAIVDTKNPIAAISAPKLGSPDPVEASSARRGLDSTGTTGSRTPSENPLNAAERVSLKIGPDGIASVEAKKETVERVSLKIGPDGIASVERQKDSQKPETATTVETQKDSVKPEKEAVKKADLAEAKLKPASAETAGAGGADSNAGLKELETQTKKILNEVQATSGAAEAPKTSKDSKDDKKDDKSSSANKKKKSLKKGEDLDYDTDSEAADVGSSATSAASREPEKQPAEDLPERKRPVSLHFNANGVATVEETTVVEKTAINGKITAETATVAKAEAAKEVAPAKEGALKKEAATASPDAEALDPAAVEEDVF